MTANETVKDGGPVWNYRCDCPDEPGCQHDEDKFALWRAVKAIVDAHDYGSGATDICRAVTDNISAFQQFLKAMK